MNMSNNQLLPCPFCGGKAEIESDDSDYPYHEAVCQECGARCHVTGCGPDDGWEWNRRVTSPPLVTNCRVNLPKRKSFENLPYDGTLIIEGWNSCIDDFLAINPHLKCDSLPPSTPKKV